MKYEFSKVVDGQPFVKPVEVPDDWVGSPAWGSHLDQALMYANLTNQDLTGLQLQDAHVRAVHLTYLRLPYADLSCTRFEHSKLCAARFDEAKLWASVFKRCDLGLASFRGASLVRATFINCDLHDTSFNNADLRAAYICECRMSPVFHKTDLRGARIVSRLDSRPMFSNCQFDGSTDITGETWATYTQKVVPALLTAGGKTLEEVVGSGCWDCHSWDNCPLHVAFGAKELAELPLLLQARASQFLWLFDQGLIPQPAI